MFKVLYNGKIARYSSYRYPFINRWTKKIGIGELHMCYVGYHVCELKDLLYWGDEGFNIYIVETKGAHINCNESQNKKCFQQIRLVKKLPFYIKDYYDWMNYCSNNNIEMIARHRNKRENEKCKLWFIRRIMQNLKGNKKCKK